MIRYLMRIVAVLALTAAVGFGYLWCSRSYYISEFLTATMQVESKVNDFSFAGDQFVFRGVHVASPKGGRIDTAFAADNLRVQANPKDLLSRYVVIDEIRIDNPLIGIELYSTDARENNWSLILNRLNLAGTHDAKASQKRCLIKKILLTNVRLHVENSETGSQHANLPPIERIELLNVGSGQPLPYRHLIAALFKEVLSHTQDRQGLEALLDNVKALPASISIDGKPSEPQAVADLDDSAFQEKLDNLERSMRRLINEDRATR